MNNGTPVCPACGSTSTYVRKQDGKVCCKSCGHGVKRRAGAVQHECPLCRSKQVYYRSKTGEYACRRCGFFTHARGTAGDLKEGFLASLPPFREIRRGRTGDHRNLRRRNRLATTGTSARRCGRWWRPGRRKAHDGCGRVPA